ncbi:MAG: hypothetical protein HXO52_04350 [Prevotella sp.]|jgi:hypothetical protein|uniref:Lipoprotein n=1 Tax=Prevotella vespertina TaxID=2608404 RepID=A0A7C9LAE2_9BACT|nr:MULTISPECIES: hypothetical protein [Prevotella]MBF1628695.1 hypothetical protein [Prevotella sp.]MBF1632394.1 hypothetical protein [Prevotella sp.]MBF1643261.1 hypothetical protein [Prevotella sp.]MBF1645250.1 hypothetical protein [Prevotella sp.]MUL27874.1 hypothetical protein [Prevotella vespertina]
MRLRQLLIVTALLVGCVINGNAKGYRPAKIYMFGFAASFNDSTVYLTDIQTVNAYLVNNRTKFLANREDYSYQLRNYLQSNGLEAYPTCITMFAENEKDATKKYLKLKERYEKSKKKYSIKSLKDSQFKYTPVEPDQQS